MHIEARMARWVLALSGAGAMAETASAGAWSQPAGEGQSISTISRELRDEGETWRADDLIEFGLGGGWETGLKFEVSLAYLDQFDSRTGAQAYIKKSFALTERTALSFQAAVVTGESLIDPDCSGGGFETRAAFGVSFNVFGREGFANIEAGRREQGEYCTRSLSEAAIGLAMTDHWRGVAKVWEERGEGAFSSKAELTLLRKFEDFSAGIGYRAEVSGAFEEEGFLVSYWSDF
jgi:hypothetical protein